MKALVKFFFEPIMKLIEASQFSRESSLFPKSWRHGKGRKRKSKRRRELRESIERQFGIKPELIKGMGGVFEVKFNNSIIFSKKKLKNINYSYLAFDLFINYGKTIRVS